MQSRLYKLNLKLGGVLWLAVPYLLIELPGLATAPLVHGDESWISSPAANLAATGVYGDPLFKGFAGQEKAYFGFPPLYPVLLALIFKLAGVGLVQARLLSVACGLACLLLTYLIATQIFDKNKARGMRLGWLAGLLLLGWRLTENGPPNYLSGIPLLDQGRIVRYDILVPVFGMSAWWLLLHNRCKDWRLFYLFSGILVGLAGLSHLFGIFWLPALLLVLVTEKGWRIFRISLAPYLLVAGTLLAWVPWLIYCSLNWTAFSEQGLEYQNQFQLTSPAFYLSNLINEPQRFWNRAGWGNSDWQALFSPAIWLLIVILVSLLLVLVKHLSTQYLPPSLKTILIPLVTQVLLYALFLQNKTVSYAITFWPLLALLATWIIQWLWHGVSEKPALFSDSNLGFWLGRGVIVGLLLAVLGQGLVGWWQLAQAQISLTNYQSYLAQVEVLLPPSARLIGFHEYWLGLHQYPYHAFTTVFFRTEPGYSAQPVSFEQALDELDGNILLVDRHLQAFLTETTPADPRRYQQKQALLGWLEKRGAVSLGQIDDPYYGSIVVYRLSQSASSSDKIGQRS